MPEYIWQHPDWTEHLRWDLEACLPALTVARLSQGRLLVKSEMFGLEQREQVYMASLLDEAMTTSAIEGQRLDRDSVRSSIARKFGLSTDGLPVPKRHIDGLVEMLLDASLRAEQPLTAERLWGWHAALFPTGYSGIHRIAVGQWRTGPEPMRVVSGMMDRQRVHFEAPPSQRVGEEMARFLSWWAEGGRPGDGILRAGLAHFWFVTIHPLDDGNGRTARALADMVLAAEARSVVRLWSLSSQIEAERKRYYAELEQAQRSDGDLTDWLRWFAGCVGRGLARAEEQLDQILLKTRFWQTHSDADINPRQRKALNRMLDAGPDGFVGGMTTRKYANLTRTSTATAQRDLADLLNKGLLARRPGGGRSTSYDVRWE